MTMMMKASILRSKRLLSSLGIITLGLIEVLFISCFFYRKEIKMFKVTVIPKTPGPKHQEFFNKAEDARWYAKMRRSSGDCWVIIERED